MRWCLNLNKSQSSAIIRSLLLLTVRCYYSRNNYKNQYPRKGIGSRDVQKRDLTVVTYTWIFLQWIILRCGTMKRALQFQIQDSVYYNPHMVRFSPDWFLKWIQNHCFRNHRCVQAIVLFYLQLLHQLWQRKLSTSNWLQPVKFFSSQSARFEVKRPEFLQLKV